MAYGTIHNTQMHKVRLNGQALYSSFNFNRFFSPVSPWFCSQLFFFAHHRLFFKIIFSLRSLFWCSSFICFCTFLFPCCRACTITRPFFSKCSQVLLRVILIHFNVEASFLPCMVGGKPEMLLEKLCPLLEALFQV